MSRSPGRTRWEGRLRRTTRTALAVLAASASVAPCAGRVRAQTVDDSVAVAGRIDAYRIVWNTHDPSALAAIFTKDADFVMGTWPAAAGRGESEESWRRYFADQEPERELTLDVRSLRFIATDVAVVNVVTTTGGRDRQGRNLLARSFRGTWVVYRQNGEWLISAMRGVPMEQDQVVLNASAAAAEEFRPEIRAFIDAYEDAFNSHDPSAVSAFYGDDADLIVRNGPLTHGRQAIADWWVGYFAEPRPYRTIFIPQDIRMITRDVALINIVATGQTTEVAPRGAPVRYARATWILSRRDSGWLISALWVLPGEDDRIIRSSGP